MLDADGKTERKWKLNCLIFLSKNSPNRVKSQIKWIRRIVVLVNCRFVEKSFQILNKEGENEKLKKHGMLF